MDTRKTFFRPRAEMILDLVRTCRFNLAFFHGYTKFKHIVFMKKKTGARMLIEAGSYHGVTAERATAEFDKVITIELDDRLAEITKNRLANYGNAEAVKGDVLKELPKILARPDIKDALVYLDGHYSGGETAQTDLAEPACEAIEILKPHVDKIAGFMVDDFRCFGRDPGHPPKSVLLRSIEKNLPMFEFTVQYDQLIAWRRPS